MLYIIKQEFLILLVSLSKLGNTTLVRDLTFSNRMSLFPVVKCG